MPWEVSKAEAFMKLQRAKVPTPETFQRFKIAMPPNEQQTMDLSDVEVTNENIALNIIVSYVNLAQKRGAFNIKESAKIWECIQKFQRASA